jgi:uncharacterized protein (TIGR03118 family)
MEQLATQTYLADSAGRGRGAFPRGLKVAAIWTAGLVAAVMAWSGVAKAQTAGVYTETSIISDGAVPATTTDPNFIDPWGVSGGNTLWIDTNVTGFSYLSSITGTLGSFKAIVPPASGTGTGQPTGTVQNTTTGFILSDGTKASFLFATLDGTISGWNGGTSAGGNHALIAVNNSANNAVYTDMALVTNTSGTYLLVPNFGQGGDVEIYNTSFQPATLQGTFTDPNVPKGYAPYAIKTLGTQVFVTYMLRTTPPFAAGAGTYQEILGTNTGFVSVFDVNGNFVARVVTGGNLNAPWGVAIAPAGFGIYAGDLLIGNFGDGLITAYSATAPYAYQGMVADGTGKAIAYPGLWDIFVSTATLANPAAIYFTAGTDGETHGLFGSIANSTSATSPATFNLSASSQVASVAPGASAVLTISVAPANAFTGTVSLSCSGLPAGTTCSFSPAQVSVSATAPATAALTIATTTPTGSYASESHEQPGRRAVWGVASALLLPFGSLLVLGRRRRFSMRMLGVVVVLVLGAGAMAGCSGYGMSGTAGTPAGTTNVTITATAGSITQTTKVALTVQ